MSEWTEAQFEELLHYQSNGPYHLLNLEIIKIIIDSWLWFQEQKNIYVYAISIMGNHVHVLIQSKDNSVLNIGSLMKAHKNFTAIACNKIVGNSGISFWEAGYYDRDLRPDQVTTLMWYILNNPVKTGLADNWWEWPGSYIHPDYAELFTP